MTYETFQPQQPGEGLSVFSGRALKFAMANLVLDDLSIETLELAAHFSGNLHTEHSTEALTATVVRIRYTVAQRRAAIAKLMAQFTPMHAGDTERTTVAGHNPETFTASGFTSAEVEFVKELFLQAGGSNDDPDSGHKVKNRKPKPVQPSPSAIANPF